VPLEKLPITILNAVEVTRKLGIKYLWVDPLCIIQDSVTDKRRKIECMGIIYKNATVTIDAANASGVSEGFLAVQKPP